MSILIGYDGSASAEAVIEDLRRAGLPRISDVLVVSVADLLMSSPPVKEVVGQVFTSPRVATGILRARTHGENVSKVAKALAAQARMRIQSCFPEWTIDDKFIAGSPAFELIALAENWKADLVIVGSEGRSVFKRILLGSVSKTIATDAQCSVRVARPAKREAADSPPRIIVGVDDSPTSIQAIHSIGQRVWPDGTEVRLINTDDGVSPKRIAYRVPQAAAMINSYQNRQKARVRSILEWGEKELKLIGIKAAIEMKKGLPDRALIEEANKWNADSIFVGTRNLNNFFERFRLGSVSTSVVTNANCSVEVVRPPKKTND